VHGGDDVLVTLVAPVSARAEAQDIPLSIVYEDRHLIVVDKPAGLVVHPAPGHPDQTLVNALLAHCQDLSGVGGELRPGIVHRLDKDTSGVMVASKDDATHHALAAQFLAKVARRQYLAVVAPAPKTDRATYATLYGRHPVHRKKFSSKVERGKSAITHTEVEERFGDLAALVRCRLETGRTHQIRVHLSDAGHAIVGDPLYGRRLRGSPLAELASQLGRQALHAAVLELDHPQRGERMTFEAPVPADLAELLAALRTL